MLIEKTFPLPTDWKGLISFCQETSKYCLGWPGNRRRQDPPVFSHTTQFSPSFLSVQMTVYLSVYNTHTSLGHADIPVLLTQTHSISFLLADLQDKKWDRPRHETKTYSMLRVWQRISTVQIFLKAKLPIFPRQKLWKWSATCFRRNVLNRLAAHHGTDHR